MTGWIIAGVILLIIVLLLMLRVGVSAAFGDVLTVRLKIGPIKIQLLPAKEKKSKKKKEKAKEKPEKAADGEKSEKKQKKAKPKLTFEDVRTLVSAAFTALHRALRKTRQRVRIEPLEFSITFAGDDPARVAELYGWADTAMWTLMPRLEEIVCIPDPHIHLDVDYQGEKLRVEGRAGADFRIKDVFAIAFAAVGPVLKWLRGYLKRQKAAKITDEKAKKNI